VRRHLAGLDVLEVACGTGAWTHRIAPACRSILATDVNAGMLALARARSLAPGTVSFRRADAYDLAGVPDERFGAAFAAFWWSHVPRERLGAFLATLHAKLRPGARVCVLDRLPVEGVTPAPAAHDAYGNTYQERTLGDGSRHLILKNFPSEADLHEALPPGLRRVAVKDFDYYWCLTYRLPSGRGGPLARHPLNAERAYTPRS
jgi:demethylmenaquinone methyltransferase/2-methoxy-6-polyprenyl-1,4-benzoquinol methylase